MAIVLNLPEPLSQTPRPHSVHAPVALLTQELSPACLPTTVQQFQIPQC